MTDLLHFAFCGRSRMTAREGNVTLHHCPSRSPFAKYRAFSLIELIAVMAIVAIMLALLTPAVSSFTSTAGRSGAVNILMNTLEQARVAALESGRTVYVIFNQRNFPDQDRILVLREPDPAEKKTDYDALSRWIPMPKGVLLHKVKKGIDILSADLPDSFDLTKSPVSLKPESTNVLAFNSYGAVSHPSTTKTKLMLFVTEGVRDHGGSEALISANKEKAGGFEIISLRRFTGRASLEVTTLN